MAVFNFNNNSPWHFSKVMRRGRCDSLEVIDYVMLSVCSGLLQNVRGQKREGDELKLEPVRYKKNYGNLR